MIIDNNLLFSNAQAITTTAVSTNVIDLGVARDLGVGDDPTLDVLVQVTTAFAGGTSLQVTVQGSVDNSTFTDMVSSNAVALANLTAGAQLLPIPFPAVSPGQALPRYIRLNYTVVGTMTAGTVTATLVLDRQRSLAYVPGITINN